MRAKYKEPPNNILRAQNFVRRRCARFRKTQRFGSFGEVSPSGPAVFRVEWSATGSTLGVSCSDNTVYLYEEAEDGWVAREALNPVQQTPAVPSSPYTADGELTDGER